MAIIFLQLTSCHNPKPATTENIAPLIQKDTVVNNAQTTNGGSEMLFMYRWYLSAINQKLIRSENDKAAHLLFYPGQRSTVAGFTGCNRLSGTFELKATNEIKFSPLAVTKMACLNDDKTERLFLPVLAETNNWKVENKTLIFYNAQNELARFTAVETIVSMLEGNWKLNYISGLRIAFDGLYPAKKPTIQFHLAQSEVTGNTSCNGYSSKYTTNANSINFKASISTFIACQGNGEKIFTDMLQKVNKYSVSGDSILNFLIDDVAVMRFIK